MIAFLVATQVCLIVPVIADWGTNFLPCVEITSQTLRAACGTHSDGRFIIVNYLGRSGTITFTDTRLLIPVGEHDICLDDSGPIS